jgi:hypothetical protein
MYKVIWNDVSGVQHEKEFVGLDLAMDWAKTLAYFVTITGNGYDIVGKFGVDSIVDGKCPDGADYTWMKRRSQ